MSNKSFTMATAQPQRPPGGADHDHSQVLREHWLLSLEPPAGGVVDQDVEEYDLIKRTQAVTALDDARYASEAITGFLASEPDLTVPDLLRRFKATAIASVREIDHQDALKGPHTPRRYCVS
jgi:hypothetical protein